MDDSPTNPEPGAVVAPQRRSSGYKSWKKKYRKMRIVFDHKMQQGEELHKREDKASATVKRLAVENDRLLDLLLEVNASPQIPPECRIDLSLPTPADPEAPALQIDRSHATPSSQSAFKRLEQLLRDVPHLSYSAAKEARSPYMADLAVAEGEAHPANFLSADDVDNYIYAVDIALDPDSHMPSLAPRARPGAHPVFHPHLKNPTSVTNWLRKHAPKIFLQDSEHAAGGAGGGADAGSSSRADRGNKANPKGKRRGAASRFAAERGVGAEGDASMEDEGEPGSTPAGRGKRKRDDDPGYRPGGSTSRLSKKKRKSEGGEPTPNARRTKKENDKDKKLVVSKDD